MPFSEYCQLMPGRQPPEEGVPEQVPRYSLCRLPRRALQRLWTFPISSQYATPYRHGNATQPERVENNDDDDDTNNPFYSTYAMAYMTSTGQALTNPTVNYSWVQTLVVTIHGSGRNADDYLCATQAAIPPAQLATTLVVAPWFLAPRDNVTAFLPQDDTKNDHSHHHHHLLRWYESNPNKTWLPHAWRYGANSIHGNISSYAVLDALLDWLDDNVKKRFPRLQQVVVTGHSAGGQYTQRWALLSSQRLLRNFYHHHPTQPSFLPLQGKQSWHPHTPPWSSPIALRVVVANPRSFCYLDPRRYWEATQQWQVPPRDERFACAMYNDWQWGLTTSSNNDDDYSNILPCPYKDRAIQQRTLAHIVQEYRHLPIVYLSGQLDVIPNGQCMDQWQGMNRRTRSRRFYQYLNHVVYNDTTTTTTTRYDNDYDQPPLIHARLEVPHVHHDHSLLYTSVQGRVALFGTLSQLQYHQQQQQQANWQDDWVHPSSKTDRWNELEQEQENYGEEEET